MKRLKVILPLGLLFLCLVYSALVFYAARKALYPDWYRPAVSADGSTSSGSARVLPPCSGYQKAAYIYCGNPGSDFNLDFETIDFERRLADRTVGMSGWLVKTAVPPSRGLVILVHGGGADRRAMLKHVPYLSKAGYDTLLMDCHNHGLAANDGHGISFGVWESESILGAMDWAKAHNYPRQAVIGTSQGAVAALLAGSKSDHSLSAIVAENPYFSFRRVLNESSILGGMPELIRKSVVVVLSFWHGTDFNELDARVYAPQLKVPVLLIHGSEDRIVGYSHSQDLMAELKTTKDFWLVPYGDHEIIWNKYRDEYEKRVLEFLEKYLQAAEVKSTGA